MTWAKYVTKAIWAGAVALLGGLAAIMVGDVGFGDITGGQWVTVLLATVLAVGGVYGFTNGPKPGSDS